MLCKYLQEIKRNDGSIATVPCGICLACRVNKKTFWTNRIQYDVASLARKGIGSSFVGLSINDDNLQNILGREKESLQKIIKRLRQHSPIKFSHFSVFEYGDKTHRPHFHCILIGVPTELSAPLLRKAWKYGFSTSEPVTSGRIRYVVDYLDYTSPQAKETFRSKGITEPFNLHSNGIGKSLFDSQLELIMDTGHYLHQNKPFPLTPYWLDKLGVPLSSRISDSVKLEKILADFRRSGFKSYSDYRLHTATQQEIISFNRSRSRLSPKFGFTPPSSSFLGSSHSPSRISEVDIYSLLEVN